MENNILEVNNLHIHYFTDNGIFKAVNGLDFYVKRGEILGLVGETGAGKTTTGLGIMNMIASPPGKIVSGQVLLDGENVLEKNKREMRRIRGKRISMIFQDPMTSLNPLEKIGAQITEVIRIHTRSSRQEANRQARNMLQLVSIPEERFNEYPHQFSGGMKQRVVISLALACRPELIIADEPTTALDVTIQAQILTLLGDLRRELNTSMLLITHDLGVVSQCCNRVAIMYAGHIFEMGDVREIYENMAHPYTVRLFAAIPDLKTRTSRLKPIPGLMPDPSDLPSGCPFWPRCANHLEICKREFPAVREIAPTHTVCCHLYDEGVDVN